MSISELGEVLFRFRGDSSQLREEINRLQGVEKEHAEAQLKHTEQQEKNLERQAKNWQALTSKFGMIKAFAGEAFEAIDHYGHKLDLEATAAGVSIDGLAKAAGGLKTNMELLEHAARLNRSAFQLTQEQMETVESAMHALEERGLSSNEVWSAFDTALSKGTTRSLEQFGIIIDKTGLQVDDNGVKMDTLGQRTKAVKAIFDGLNKSLGKEMAEASLDAADQVTALQVKFKNFWDDMKEGLAKLALEFTPVLDQLARALDLLGKIGDVGIPNADGGSEGGVSIGDGFKWLRNRGGLNPVTAIPTNIKNAWDYSQRLAGNEVSKYVAQGASGFGYQTRFDQSMNAFMASGAYGGAMEGPQRDGINNLNVQANGLAVAFAGLRSVFDDPWRSKPGAGGAAGPYTGTLAGLGIRTSGALLNERTDPGGLRLAGLQGLGGSAGDGSQLGGAYDRFSLQGMINQLPERIGDKQGYNKYLSSKNESFLEKTFGKVDEFNVYQSLFAGLGDAIGGTYEAIITGSEPAGQAFKKLIGQAVMATGKGELIEGLKEAAWAIGRLAIGDFAGAALHGESAAQHLAVAALAGVVASELGAGSSGAKPSAGGKPTAPNPGGGGGGNGNNQSSGSIIVYGDDFTDSSARMRQLKAKKLVDLALGTSSSRNR